MVGPSPSLLYIPSPVQVAYKKSFLAVANSSGRMQYYRKEKGQTRQRISRADFIAAYNSLHIIALKPIPHPHQDAVFQVEIFVG